MNDSTEADIRYAQQPGDEMQFVSTSGRVWTVFGSVEWRREDVHFHTYVDGEPVLVEIPLDRIEATIWSFE